MSKQLSFFILVVDINRLAGGYRLFAFEERERLLNNWPEARGCLKELTKIIHERWNQLPDDIRKVHSCIST